MKAIDRVRNAYQARRRKLVVPEWDNLELYFGPVVGEDMESIRHRLKDSDSLYEQAVLLVIHMAKDKEGKALFGMGDKRVLMQEAEVKVINRIAAFIWGSTPMTDAEADKELEDSPN